MSVMRFTGLCVLTYALLLLLISVPFMHESYHVNLAEEKIEAAGFGFSLDHSTNAEALLYKFKICTYKRSDRKCQKLLDEELAKGIALKESIKKVNWKYSG